VSGEQNGDYFEGLEEGISIGRREAIEAAVAAAQRPAGSRLLDFHARQAIIVNRVRNCLTGDS
jgi:hypothetical protein